MLQPVLEARTPMVILFAADMKVILEPVATTGFTIASKEESGELFYG
jgi:hypothetical protein